MSWTLGEDLFLSPLLKWRRLLRNPYPCSFLSCGDQGWRSCWPLARISLAGGLWQLPPMWRPLQGLPHLRVWCWTCPQSRGFRKGFPPPHIKVGGLPWGRHLLHSAPCRGGAQGQDNQETGSHRGGGGMWLAYLAYTHTLGLGRGTPSTCGGPQCLPYLPVGALGVGALPHSICSTAGPPP